MEGNGENLNLSGGSAGDGSRRDPPPKRIKTEEEVENIRGGSAIELELGLSTNGQFGVDPARARKLERSASADDPSGNAARGSHAPPLKTTSLPADFGGREARTRSDPTGKGKAPMVYSSEGIEMHGDGNGGADVQYLGSRRGVGVQFLGTGGSRESPSPHGISRVPHGANQNTMMSSSAGPERGNEASPAAGSNLNGKQKLMTSALLNMPSVTLVPSPIHRQIEGILYRYRKAEELKIVCVCHGMFLSPAEFIKHGGGGDVEDPLKHIVVNPSPVFQV